MNVVGRIAAVIVAAFVCVGTANAAPKHWTETYDLVPSAGTTANAIAFDYVGWTHVAYLPGRTAFTAHTRVFHAGSDYAGIKSATVRAVLSGDGALARLVSLRYDQNGNAIWRRDFGTLAKRNGYVVDNVALDVTAQVRSELSTAGMVQFTAEVASIAPSRLYSFRLEIEYEIDDYADAISALNERVTALENLGQ